MTAKPYDPTLKALVEADPASWPALLGCPAGPTAVIDADVATVSGAADKVLRVDAATPYLLHLEFVAGHDAAALPRKLHVRNGLLEDRHDLPVRSAAILLRPEADSPRLTGVYERGFPGEGPYLTFRYQAARIWQLRPEPLLTGGLALMPLAVISAVTEAELPGIIKRIERRLTGGRGRKQAPAVWAASFILFGLRHTSALAAHLFRGVVSMKESSTYQMIVEEGRAEGLALGRAEGLALGVTKGAVVEARKLLRKFGDGRFGPPDAGAAAAIDRIDDLARLEEMCDRLETAANWQELLGPPATARARRRRRPSP